MQNVPFYIDVRTWLAPGLHGAAVNQMQIQIGWKSLRDSIKSKKIRALTKKIHISFVGQKVCLVHNFTELMIVVSLNIFFWCQILNINLKSASASSIEYYRTRWNRECCQLRECQGTA